MHEFLKLRPKPRQYYNKSLEVDESNLRNMEEIKNSFSMPKEKSIVPATVSGVTKDYVWVNIGIKSEGRIDINEFKINGFGKIPNVGDLISVWIDKHEDSNGSMVISFSKVNQIRSWKDLEEIFQGKKLVEGTITEKVRGGFIVILLPWGVKSFLPSSQIDYSSLGGKASNLLQTMRNKKMQFFIIRMERKWNIIVSQKSDNQNDSRDSRPDSRDKSSDSRDSRNKSSDSR
ncbi:hypothetical protein FZC35_00310 [Candidatus Cytomitobacter indipagum]|uniref:S1 motif domain-containing protein n=1 Tax=Candidatus Cytomitobacter indipagum TaxID=2601575 RepID=A0A5C0UEY8_9PROT|nr:hypothetical protein [Candidatus Cytomitobacter indipagum]QEK37832.1 hypothetical protein FZC35_00310 [Candidatus Cytomitobacter indipagum]